MAKEIVNLKKVFIESHNLLLDSILWEKHSQLEIENHLRLLSVVIASMNDNLELRLKNNPEEKNGNSD